jgi:hypothetical protein
MPCDNNLPANAVYTAPGDTKNAQSCPWQCGPGFIEVGQQAEAGPSCTPSVGGAAGLKALEAAPGAAMSGGMALPVGVLTGGDAAGPAAAAAAAAPAASAAEAAVASAAGPSPPMTAAPTESGESSDTANAK